MKRIVSACILGAALCASPLALAQHPEPAAHGEPAPAGDHAGHGDHGDHAAPGHGGHGGHGDHGAHAGFHQPGPINWFNPSPHAEVEVHNGVETRRPGPPPFVGPIINFLILLGIGYMALRRSINPALASRRAAVEAELGEASRLRTEAEALHTEYTERLAGLEAEMERLKGEFVRAGEAERDRIVAEAKAKAERMRQDGAETLAQELKSMREDLRREAVLAAAAAAEETVRASINAADQTRLADEFVTGLEAHVRAQGAGAQA